MNKQTDSVEKAIDYTVVTAINELNCTIKINLG